MKFTCSRDELDRQLQYISRVVTPRSTLPILSNILLETDGDKIRLSATDLELAIATHVPASIEQEGSFTVPAKLFQDFIHQSPDASVTFQLQSNEFVIQSDQVAARIPGIEAEEYPPLPTVSDTTDVTLPVAAFVAALRQVAIACAQDQGRPVLTGVLCRVSQENLVLAATDSFRLVERQLPGIPVPQPAEILIPYRTVQELIRVAAQMGEDGDLSLSLGEQQAIFRLGDVEIYSRLLVGNFPKYQAIIPTSFMADIVVDTQELVQGLRLTTIFAQAGVANVILEVAEDGTVKLQSHATQRGGATHTLKGEMEPGGKTLKAAFNTRFLLDALGACGADKVTLRLSGPLSPLIVSTGDASYTQVVMPIRMDA